MRQATLVLSSRRLIPFCSCGRYSGTRARAKNRDVFSRMTVDSRQGFTNVWVPVHIGMTATRLLNSYSWRGGPHRSTSYS